MKNKKTPPPPPPNRRGKEGKIPKPINEWEERKLCDLHNSRCKAYKYMF